MQIQSTLKILILFSLIYFTISGGYQCNINNCQACSYPNACGACINNYVLTLNTTSSSFYCNPVTCAANCMTCYQNNTCQVCNNNFFLTSNGTCSTSSSSNITLPLNCLVGINNMNCQLCSYGYTLKSGFCYPTISMTPVDQNCLVKMTSSICQICQSPYIVGFLGNCVQNPQTSNTPCGVANCLFCQNANSTCLTCMNGYQLTPSGTCVINFCNISNCLICSNTTQCQTCMNGYILSTNKQTCQLIGYGCNINWCVTCSNSQSCGQCQTGYQLKPFSFGSSTVFYCQKLPCPFNVTNCLACTQNYNSIFQFNQVLCSLNSCMSGYINVNGYCVSNITTVQISCNVNNCASCSYNNFCGQCQSGYSLTRYGTCLSTMCNVQNCQYCSVNNICQQCNNGYSLTIGNIALWTSSNIVNFFNFINQQQCTLNTNISCNLAHCQYCISNNVCALCSNGYDFDTSGINCIATCNVQNCYQCVQNQNITTALCSVCQNGYSLSSNGMQCTMMNFTCGNGCTNYTTSCVYNQQTNSGQCLQCTSNMILYNGQCYSAICNIYGCDICAPWAASNTLCLRCQQSLVLVDGYCVTSNCNNGVPNCVNCIQNGRCIGCKQGYYLQNSTNGTVSCISAASISGCSIQNCLICKSGNPYMCQTCATPYIANANGQCVCNFQNCLDCSQSALTCNSCPAPLFASLYQAGCTPQPSLLLNCSVNNCQYCITPNQCSICGLGYSLNSSLGCNLNNCSALGLSNCQLCDPFGYQCHLCNTGFMVNNFLQGGSCSPLNQGYTCNITGCAVCNSANNSICSICLPTYSLNSSSNTCTPYTCNISNCYLCLANNFCTICLSGYYLANNMQCMPKFSQIVNCQGSINYCDICVSGLYNPSSSSNYCIKCMNGFQYNTVLGQCLPQQNSIPNCLVQIPNYNLNNLPICLVCQQGYYINSWGVCSQYVPQPNNSNCTVYNCMYCGLNNSTCSFCFVPWGISSTGLCQTNISSICTQNNCITCVNSSYCTGCSSTYIAYLGNCIMCNIAGCSFCQTANNCSACLPTYNLTSQNLCIACNINNCLNCSNNNICANCQIGYSISSTGNQCVTCGVTNCLACRSNGVCGICSNGYQLNLINNNASMCISCNVSNCLNCSNTNYCNQCVTGYTQINGNCTLCLYPCATCNANGTCATCITPTFYNLPSSNGSCFASTVPNCMNYNLSSTSICLTCNSGYQYITTTNTCLFSCNVANCSICINNSASICQTCNPGFYLSPSNSSNCLACNILGCTICNPANPSQCQTCLSGFYLSNSECKQCPTYCASCTSYTSCDTLLNSNQQVLMTINSTIVLAICSQGCLTCSNINPSICTSCSNGLYFNNGICQLCNQLCLTCSSSNPNTCLSCYPNSFLNGKTCITCSNNCQSCSNINTSICTSCFPGSYLINQTCTQGCPNNCLTCSSSSVCTNCVTGYTLFGQGVCAPCVTNCRICAQGLPASCLQCGNGFYLLGSKCIQCAINCALCTSVGCNSCIQGYFLTSALTCSINCKLPCSTCSANIPTKCTGCIAGYSYSNTLNQCIQQLTCNGACSVCPIGYILQTGQCIPCSVSNCQLCSSSNLNQCLSCSPGYYLNSNRCQPCPPSCATCLRGNGCTSCASGYTYNSLQNIQPSGYQCEACQFPCATCLNSTSYCTSCVQGYTFTGWKCTQTFYFGFTVTLTVNSSVFNQNYLNFITALSQAIGSSSTNIVTITGITFSSVIVDGGVAPTASSASLQSNQQYNSLDSLLSVNNQIAGMTVGSSSITVVGGSINYDKLNLALILGICIPVGVLIIAGVSLYIYCRRRKASQVIQTKIKEDSGFTVRQSFELSTKYQEKDSSRPFEEFTSIN